jgi:antitoxin HicB
VRYPVTLEKDGEGWFASFPDIPEALTSGTSIDHALQMAKDALITAMDFYFEDGRAVPLPAAIEAGQYTVDLPASLWAKVLLLNEMLAQQKRPTDLALMLGAKLQDVQRLFNLKHPTKIDKVEQALAALGKHLVLATI